MANRTKTSQQIWDAVAWPYHNLPSTKVWTAWGRLGRKELAQDHQDTKPTEPPSDGVRELPLYRTKDGGKTWDWVGDWLFDGKEWALVWGET